MSDAFERWFLDTRRVHPAGLMTLREVITFLDLDPVSTDDILRDLIMFGRLHKIPADCPAPDGRYYFDSGEVVSVARSLGYLDDPYMSKDEDEEL